MKLWCPDCNGTGKKKGRDCKTCHGKGELKVRKTLSDVIGSLEKPSDKRNGRPRKR